MKIKIALFSISAIIIMVVCGFLFQRDEITQISRGSGHKRHLVRVLGFTVYAKNINTELGELVNRSDDINEWAVSSSVKHRLGGVLTECTVWAALEVEIYKNIKKWREEGVQLPDQRRMARSYLDEGIANFKR